MSSPGRLCAMILDLSERRDDWRDRYVDEDRRLKHHLAIASILWWHKSTLVNYNRTCPELCALPLINQGTWGIHRLKPLFLGKEQSSERNYVWPRSPVSVSTILNNWFEAFSCRQVRLYLEVRERGQNSTSDKESQSLRVKAGRAMDTGRNILATSTFFAPAHKPMAHARTSKPRPLQLGCFSHILHLLHS
jgi:hypothetical protein